MDVRDDLLEALRAGASVADAARNVGVPKRTVEGWLTRGHREPESIYASFTAAVDEIRRSRSFVSSDPMSEDELLGYVSRAARAGSVPAMRLCWEMLRGGRDEGQENDPLAQLDDELAVRRAVPQGGH